jgi:Amidohydrolase family
VRGNDKDQGSYNEWDEIAWLPARFAAFYRPNCAVSCGCVGHAARRCTAGAAGFLYNLPGFGFIQELKLLREAGFTPLEVIRAATQSGARALGHEDQVGMLKLGMKADIIAIKGNPLANLKLLYPTGTIRLNHQTQRTEQVGGIDYIIKDGIVYDGQQLRDEVKAMVAKQKADRHIGPGVMPVVQQ